MTNASYQFAHGAPMAAAQATAATGAPDFARHDRGEGDDHWVRAAGEDCARCGQTIVEGAFVRRRADGGWAHQECPIVITDEAEPASE